MADVFLDTNVLVYAFDTADEAKRQRALAVLGDAPRKRHAEAVVEDLQAEPAVVAGGKNRVHEGVDRQVALAGEVAEMPAPAQHVHVELRRVGELDQFDPVAGDRGDRLHR